MKTHTLFNLQDSTPTSAGPIVCNNIYRFDFEICLSEICRFLFKIHHFATIHVIKSLLVKENLQGVWTLPKQMCLLSQINICRFLFSTHQALVSTYLQSLQLAASEASRLWCRETSLKKEETLLDLLKWLVKRLKVNKQHMVFPKSYTSLAERAAPLAQLIEHSATPSFLCFCREAKRNILFSFK